VVAAFEIEAIQAEDRPQMTRLLLLIHGEAMTIYRKRDQGKKRSDRG
jgi:hypothetical protein